jgi:signal peptidase I
MGEPALLHSGAAAKKKNWGEGVSVDGEGAAGEGLPQAEPQRLEGTDAGPQTGAATGGGPRPGAGVRSWLRDLVVSVAVSAFIIIFLYQPVRVEGTSMLPVLEDQDRLFINKIAYRLGEIHAGDVVVFQYPRDHSKSYIKRVIGLPGDRLRIDRGDVYVNGKLLPEPYVPNRFTDDRSQAEVVLAANEYFVMGDHRSISSDSRDFGPVDRDLIFGKAVFVYWPIEQVGVVR